LHNIQAVRMYKSLYYLVKKSAAGCWSFRMLYKYLRNLTEREKTSNPASSEFV
jgi:hypothetical protein